MSMRLSELLKGLEFRIVSGDPDMEVASIAYDSRKASRGTLFVCIEGYVTDGHKYVRQAASQGTTAFLVQKAVDVPAGATVVEIADTRKGLAHVSDLFFGHPSGKLHMIGITGTKGKTTSSFMVRAILRAAGRRTGLIGTIANIIGDEVVYASRTTPESYDLQSLLADMVSAGMDSCVMEVSSQGLALDRVYRTEYDTGVFTNLYNDHIGPSEHATFEEYLSAKALLFSRCRNALVNGDAPHADASAQPRPVGYSPSACRTAPTSMRPASRKRSETVGSARNSMSTHLGSPARSSSGCPADSTSTTR